MGMAIYKKVFFEHLG